MSLRCTLEQSLFTMGNRLAQARADVERWLAEPAASCRALDLSQLEDRVMLSASPAAQAILSEAPVAAVDLLRRQGAATLHQLVEVFALE